MPVGPVVCEQYLSEVAASPPLIVIVWIFYYNNYLKEP